ncbi:MAG: YtfJ family protein [Desulfobacterales bacterium]|nr:YtfJ family protein [Desulfobacterales bacterium]
MSRSLLWKSLVIVFGCAMIAFAAGSVSAASVGQELSNVQIRDENDKPATIPDFGTHVISLFYADTSVSDIADPLSDAIKAKKYDKGLYRGVGVANMKDSAVPNFVIRKIIKGKIEKYKSTILTDVDLTLPKAWGLGTCKGKSVFILIGKDKKIKYLKYADKNNPWNKAEIDNVLKMMDDLIIKK